MTIACGREIADTYADFMLAFVPHSCDKKREALAGPSDDSHDVIETKISPDNSARSQSTEAPSGEEGTPTGSSSLFQSRTEVVALCLFVLLPLFKC